ncbi:uncharacterized protein LOC121807705 isoform X2 [Salvia splendens]|uniref:uncharacterized protein LOC121807705 isoform X2 n=1 Tax=Salvia splendens TaxID=180675 RepID=UPI001C275684|nr:uncharacterized protein LOC121807705 isoform X2 [Salvia splendens]
MNPLSSPNCSNRSPTRTTSAPSTSPHSMTPSIPFSRYMRTSISNRSRLSSPWPQLLPPFPRRSFPSGIWMVVSPSIRRLPISSSHNGGIARPIPSTPPHRLHFRPHHDSQNGASGFGDSQLEIALRHSIRLPPSLHLNPSFFRSLRRLRYHPQHHPWKR